MSVKGVMTRADSKTATVSYLEAVQQIGWGTGTGSVSHHMSLKLVGDSSMVAEAGSEELTIEALGQRIIEGVLP